MKRFYGPKRLKKADRSIFGIFAVAAVIAVYETISLVIKLISSDKSNILLLILLLVINIPLMQRLYWYYKARKRYSSEKARINSDIVILEELHHLTPREFELWSVKFLELLGYSDIHAADLGPDGGKDIICKKGGATVYVECKRYVYDELGYVKYIVNKEIVEKLVGAMVWDDVKCGLILTTGMVTKDAVEFARTLDGGMIIRIIDGIEMVAIYNRGKEENSKLSLSFSK